MRKWLPLLLLALILAFPSLAAAQDDIRLASLDIKLWPEYDQPKMLVIYDFLLAPDAALPARVSFRIPADAVVTAVAALKNGQFVNSAFDAPRMEGNWQVITVIVDSATSYRFEYYRPLAISGQTRKFSFTWPGDHSVDAFRIGVQRPLDTNAVTTEPSYPAVDETDGLTYYNSQVFSIAAGEQYKLTLEYKKSSDRLTVPSTDIQAAAPLDKNTAGRVSIGIYIPYIVGALGVIFVVGGLGYYFLWARLRPAEQRPPRRVRASRNRSAASAAGGEVYCSQCGQRAEPGDRFCRICGTRIRQQEN